MGEFNYYQAYFQGGYAKERPGLSVKRVLQDERATVTDKQFKFHADLIAFLESKGRDPIPFKKPRDRRDCRSKINAMLTTLKKNGWAEEFFGKSADGERKDDAESTPC